MSFHDDTLTVDLCDVELPFAFADSLFTETTVYTHFDTTLLGCDSNTTLVLNVHKTYTEVDTVEIQTCRADLPTLVRDSLLTEEGVYTFHALSEAGCDSITDIIRFSIHPDHEQARMCYYQRGIVYDDILQDHRSAEEEFRDFIHLYPDDPLTPQLKQYLSLMGKSEKEIEQALNIR